MKRAEDRQALVNSLLVRGLVLEALVRPSSIYKAEVRVGRLSPIYKAEVSAVGKAISAVGSES